MTVQLHDNGGTAGGGGDTSAAQTFTITVDIIPAITSANAATFTVGTAGTFTVTSTGDHARWNRSAGRDYVRRQR